VFIWSIMATLCGLAKNFTQLFLARIGVGVGEAALSPAAFSLMADYFPPRKVALAISVYSMGLYFGAGLALMIGGTVVAAVSNAPTHELPIIGTVFPWQLTFFVVAALGLPILLLMFLIREPVRRGAAHATAATAARPSGWPALRAFMRANRRTLTCHISAFTLFGIGINCYLFWAPTLMMRTHGWTAPQAGFTIGAMLFGLGTAGVYSGGWLADRLAGRGRRRGPAGSVLRHARGVAVPRRDAAARRRPSRHRRARHRRLFHGVYAGPAVGGAATRHAEPLARPDDRDLFLHRQPDRERPGPHAAGAARRLRLPRPRDVALRPVRRRSDRVAVEPPLPVVGLRRLSHERAAGRGAGATANRPRRARSPRSRGVRHKASRRAS
jgi:hypothetical protein